MPRQNTKITSVKPAIHVKPITSPPVIIKNNNTLFGSIKEGFGFGLGSTIARNLFTTTPTPIPSSNNLDIRKPTCIEYKKCLESEDKYECFGNLDQREYIECRTNI